MNQLIRNFKKQKFVSLLNICTLSLGIMVAIIVGLWAIQELSFDNFHKEKDRIYRVVTNMPMNGGITKIAVTQSLYGKLIREKLPAVENMCRVVKFDDNININNVGYPETCVYLVDNNFFSFFTFPLLTGTLGQVLSTPDKVVISESAATKYFPQQDPIGQTVKYENRDFTVSGVMKDMPQNSSLQTDFVFPLFGEWLDDDGRSTAYHTFLLLQQGMSVEKMTEPVAQVMYDAVEGAEEFGITYSLEALGDVHFGTEVLYDFTGTKGSKSFILIFALVALIILIISCINFASLFVSTSFVRAKTIGVKKCFGAGKSLLMREFYLETACYVTVSVVSGVLLAVLAMPVFNNFTQSNLTVDFTLPQLYCLLAVLFVFTVLLAGSYPALYMTRFNVIESLSGKFKGRQASFFQKGLVIIQFVAAISLLIVINFMQKQVNYIISYDLGFDKEHIIYVQGRNHVFFGGNYNALKGEFLKEPAIIDVARKNGLPTEDSNIWTVNKIPSEGRQDVMMEICEVSPDYFDVLGMKFIDDESPFQYETWKDNEVVINESAVQLLNLDQPVGQTLAFSRGNKTIKGVIKNAHTKSLHQDIPPQVYIKLNDNWIGNVVFFKIAGNPQKAISFIEQKWKERDRESGHPFEYHFLDDTYKQLYQSEMNAGKVLAFATLITFIITVAGLFAMVYYATRRRVREIALRKVHGATAGNIFVLLNKDFLLWVAIAFVIACPIAYYALYRWLSGFAVKTPLSVWIFLLVGAIALLVTLLTTGYQTWKAATENPIKALKTE